MSEPHPVAMTQQTYFNPPPAYYGMGNHGFFHHSQSAIFTQPAAVNGSVIDESTGDQQSSPTGTVTEGSTSSPSMPSDTITENPHRRGHGKRCKWSQDMEKTLLKQMMLPGMNPLTASHGQTGKTWSKLVNFMTTQFGCSLNVQSVQRHVESMVSKRAEEVIREEKETGTNHNFGEFEQLIDEFIQRHEEHVSERERIKQVESTKQKESEEAIANVRHSAMKRAKERQADESPSKGRHRKKKNKKSESPSKLERFFEQERQAAQERKEWMEKLMETQVASQNRQDILMQQNAALLEKLLLLTSQNSTSSG